jgi:adenylosuccinate synthase
LFEGAQGSWLDIDHGTYPYVTSSNTTIGGVCTGAGIAPQHIAEVIGVTKAYTTRVGEGPFPTEIFGADGEKLRSFGKEFGATTGRPRRCGWFDTIANRHAITINGITSVAITKLDVLSAYETINIGVGYMLHGKQISNVPADSDEWVLATPVYESFPGWQCDISNTQSWDELPANAQKYIQRLAALLHIRVSMVSIGPSRQQTFYL